LLVGRVIRDFRSDGRVAIVRKIPNNEIGAESSDFSDERGTQIDGVSVLRVKDKADSFSPNPTANLAGDLRRGLV